MFSSSDLEEMGRGCTTVVILFVIAVVSLGFGVGWFMSRAVEKEPAPIITEEPEFKYGDFVIVTSGFFEGAKGYVSDYSLKLGTADDPTAMKYEVEFHRLPEGAPDLSRPPEVEYFTADQLRMVPIYGPLKPMGVPE